MHPQQDRLIQAAQNAGIQTEDLSAAWSQDAVRYSLAEAFEVIFAGNGFGSTTLLASSIASDLPITRHYLTTLGIRNPVYKVLKLDDEHTSESHLTAQLGEFWSEGLNYACRPAYDLTGHGTASNLKSRADLEIHLDTFGDDYATWVIEEQPEGQNLQILAINGQMEAAITRHALELVGDGVKTLEELIDAHNQMAAVDDQIEMNAETRQLLRDQSLFLSEQVPSGLAVQLKNASAGGSGAVDVTTQLHPRYAQWVSKIAEATGLEIFTMSCRTTDPSGDPQSTGWVLDLRAKPEWLQFADAQGNEKDIPALILASIFKIKQ